MKEHPDCAYGAPFYLLSHHRMRLLNAVKYFHEQGLPTEGRGRWNSILKWLENKVEFEKDMLKRLMDIGVSLDGPLRVTNKILTASNKASFNISFFFCYFIFL